MKEDGFLSLFHPDELENITEHMKKVNKLKSNEKTINIKYRFKNRKGKYLTLISRDTILKFDEKHKPIEIIGSFVDISEFLDETNNKKHLERIIDSLDIEDAKND
jgi:hypothetical protein